MVDTSWLETQLQRLNPISYKIDPKSLIMDSEYRYVPWASLFYSAMIANHLKREHEAKHGFRYDCVARGRFDIIFRPEFKFSPLTMNDRTLYHPHLNRFQSEASFINASDPFFYGDTWGMDVVSDIFRNVVRDHVNITRADNLARIGPGTLMSRYCRRQNVEHLHDSRPIVTETIYRKEMLGKDALKDFNEIHQNHRSYYHD